MVLLINSQFMLQNVALCCKWLHKQPQNEPRGLFSDWLTRCYWQTKHLSKHGFRLGGEFIR